MPGTTLEDWRRFLRFARDSYPIEFLVELVPREMPDDPATIFQLGQHDPVLLRIFVGGVQLNSYFFTTTEIDLDLDPTEVETPADASRVLRFLKELGDALNRTVLMTYDGAPDLVVYRYDPHTPEPVYLTR